MTITSPVWIRRVGETMTARYAGLRTMRHALLVQRGLRGFYRVQAVSRMLISISWTVILVVFVDAPVPVMAYVAAGTCAVVGAVAAWSHHHDGALDWMSDRPGLGFAAGYLHRTARDRRISVDIPGLVEGTALIAMTLLTAVAAPAQGTEDELPWSIAFALLVTYLPFIHYVIDPSWYQPRYADQPGYAWFRYALPTAFAGVAAIAFWTTAPPDAANPNAGIVVAVWLLRLYVDMSLEDALVGGLDDALRDHRKDLADAVSSEVHSRVKNELRILAAELDLDAQPPMVQATWHSLVHNVERLRRHPFRDAGRRRSTAEIVEAVHATVRALADDPAAIRFTTDTSDFTVAPLRSTDLGLLELVLGDLCANSVREANRTRSDGFEIHARLVTTTQSVTVTVADTGSGFPAGHDRDETQSSLTVLDRRLRRRGGGLDLGRSAKHGGAQVTATWRAL